MKNIILFANRINHIGGMEKHALRFHEYFSESSKFHLIKTICKKNENSLQNIDFENNQIYYLNSLNQYQPDILFFNTGHWIEEMDHIQQLCPSALMIYRTGGNEIIRADLIATNIKSHRKRQLYWVKTINKYIDLLITNSTYTEERLRSLGVETKFLRVVGGVDDFKPPVKNFIFDDSVIKFFSAARFIEYKGHPYLINIMHKLKENNLNYQLRLAGSGPTLDSNIALVKRLGLNKHINFLGDISPKQISDELHATQFYIQTSIDHQESVIDGYYTHSECMGRSILEAIASGTFIIANNAGAISEIVTKDRGLLIDVDNMEKSINDIMNCVKKIRLLKPTNQYSWKRIFNVYEQKFEEITSGH